MSLGKAVQQGKAWRRDPHASLCDQDRNSAAERRELAALGPGERDD